jgi:hypothetical protein
MIELDGFICRKAAFGGIFAVEADVVWAGLQRRYFLK